MTERKKTFLDPEEYAYPDGSLRQSHRHFAALCEDGEVRRGICGIPDTCFSIPAHVKSYGKTISGYVAANRDGDILFIAYSYGKNHAILDGRKAE